MNYQRKQSAIKRYAHLLTEGASREQLMEELAKDEKEYSADEINEIVTAIVDGGGEDTSGEEGQTTKLNKDYEEWSVEPKYVDVKDPMGKVLGRKLDRYEKIKKLRTTRVTKAKADILNEQSENTLVRLY